MVASNQTQPEIGAVNLGHAGAEQYGNMWQKVRSMWQYVHEHYLDDFEFFHIGGDDMFVIADNLRYATSLEDSSQPLYMGAAMVDHLMPRKRYCGGGAGYTLSREALKRMVENEFGYIRCNPEKTRPDEDKLIATCLRLRVAKCTHNMDEKNETRYHHYDAQFHARWDRRRPVNWDWRHLLKWHNIIAYKERLEGISETSATFHLIRDSIYRDRGLRRYHALLYGLCGGEDMKLEPLPQGMVTVVQKSV
jgi:glycoprotein-N-acetylgalactosamine 3-beta-galactosyltransferase